MENKTNIKAGEEVHIFFYDLKSNLGIVLKENNKKRISYSKTELLGFLIKHFKLNNEGYQELINLIIKNGSK